jgi:hypothetical protein
MTRSLRITIQNLPISVEAYIALHARTAISPEGGAAMLVVALLLFTRDEALGRECLAVAGARPPSPRDIQFWRTQLGSAGHVPRSYIVGATPGNGYSLPPGPLAVEIVRNPYSGDESSGRCKVFAISSGADSPRPVTLLRNERGLWRGQEWSSLLSGVRLPEKVMFAPPAGASATGAIPSPWRDIFWITPTPVQLWMGQSMAWVTISGTCTLRVMDAERLAACEEVLGRGETPAAVRHHAARTQWDHLAPARTCLELVERLLAGHGADVVIEMARERADLAALRACAVELVEALRDRLAPVFVKLGLGIEHLTIDRLEDKTRWDHEA